MTYCVSFRFHNTGQVSVMRCETALERALAIIGFCARADVLDQWTEE